MIGVALVSAITIMASSTKASIDEVVDRTFHGDLVVDSGAFDAGGLSPDMAAQIATLPEVAAVSGVRTAPATVDGSSSLLASVDPATIDQVMELGVVDGSLADLGAGTIAVSDDEAESHGWTIGDRVPVTFVETGEQALTVAAVYDEGETMGPWFVGHPTFEANVADQFDVQVLVGLADGVDVEQGRRAVTTVTDANPLAEVQDRAEYREAMGSKVDMLLNLVYALLALAVVIALLGIVNTLALSIVERTRELGLLRAVGMTRRQLRTTVRYESVIIALLGTTLGIAVGVGFGWALVTAMADLGLGVFALPVPQLAAVAVVAALAGVGAAVLPARRAARLDVLGAISG
jgi:putative ABC transport system permease protein